MTAVGATYAFTGSPAFWRIAPVRLVTRSSERRVAEPIADDGQRRRRSRAPGAKERPASHLSPVPP